MPTTIPTLPLHERALLDCASYLKQREDDDELYALDARGSIVPRRKIGFLEKTVEIVTTGNPFAWHIEESKKRLELVATIRRVATMIQQDYPSSSSTALSQRHDLETKLLELYCDTEKHGEKRLCNILKITRDEMLEGKVSYYKPPCDHPITLAERAEQDMRKYENQKNEEKRNSVMASLKEIPCTRPIIQSVDTDQSDNRQKKLTTLRELSSSILAKRNQGQSRYLREQADDEEQVMFSHYIKDNISKSWFQGSKMLSIIEKTKIDLLRGGVICAKSSVAKTKDKLHSVFVTTFIEICVRVYRIAEATLQPEHPSVMSAITDILEAIEAVTDYEEIKIARSIIDPIFKFFRDKNTYNARVILNLIKSDNIGDLKEMAIISAHKFLEEHGSTISQCLNEQTTRSLAKMMAISGMHHVCANRYMQHDGTFDSLIECSLTMNVGSLNSIIMSKASRAEKKAAKRAITSAIIHVQSSAGESSFYKPRHLDNTLIPEIETWQNEEEINTSTHVKMTNGEMQGYWANKILEDAVAQMIEGFNMELRDAIARDPKKRQSSAVYTLRPEAKTFIKEKLLFIPLIETVTSENLIEISEVVKQQREILVETTASFLRDKVVRPSKDNPLELKLQEPLSGGPSISLFKKKNIPNQAWREAMSQEYNARLQRMPCLVNVHQICVYTQPI